MASPELPAGGLLWVPPEPLALDLYCVAVYCVASPELPTMAFYCVASPEIQLGRLLSGLSRAASCGSTVGPSRATSYGHLQCGLSRAASYGRLLCGPSRAANHGRLFMASPALQPTYSRTLCGHWPGLVADQAVVLGMDWAVCLVLIRP